jgi:hypothetical protein
MLAVPASFHDILVRTGPFVSNFSVIDVLMMCFKLFLSYRIVTLTQCAVAL